MGNTFGSVVAEYDLSLATALVPILVLLAGGLLVWCYFKPAVGRFLARIFAVVAMAGGVGLLVWGILAAARRETPTADLLFDLGTSGIIGCGAGLLTAGLVALVLSFIRSRESCP
jgi:hypothetical protein